MTYVISDLHGCYDKWKAMLEQLNLKEDDMSDADCKKVDEVAEEIENFSLLCDDIAKTPHVPLSEKMRLNV